MWRAMEDTCSLITWSFMLLMEFLLELFLCLLPSVFCFMSLGHGDLLKFFILGILVNYMLFRIGQVDSL